MESYAMAAKIKLLHITSSLKVGGAENILCTLLEQLPRDRFEHHVIYFHDGPMRVRIEASGIPTYHVRGLFALYDPFFWVRLYRCIKKINPDHIHALLWAANVASRIVTQVLKVPIVCVYHNNIDQDGWVRNVLDRLTVGYAQTIVAVSDEVVDSICAHVPYIKKESVHVIKNGIDRIAVESICRKLQVSRNSIGLKKEHFVIGSVGRFVPVKNYPLLLRTFALLHAKNDHVRLVLVGLGPDEDVLRNLACKLDIADNVHFIVGQKAYGYYPLFDVFVQSSDKEGISIALLEAMCAGVPCIVTNRNDFHSVIKHGYNGLLVPHNNAHLLAAALEKLMHNQKLCSNLVRNAYVVLEKNFDQHKMISAYQRLYEAPR